MFSRLRVIARALCFVLVFVQSTILLAQASVDVVVSPLVRSRLPLPHLQQQSAATIGRTTLAVWSASVNHGPDTLAVVMQMQLFHDGIPFGEQRTLCEVGRLNDPRLVPTVHLKVVAARNAFLVLWDDLASYSVHARRVSLDGEPLDTAWTVDDNALLHLGTNLLPVVGDPAMGQAIIWSDALGSSTTLRIDADARPLGPRDSLGAPFDQIYTYSGFYFIHFYTSFAGGRIIHRDGSRDPRPLPFDRDVSAFYLGPDSSLAILGAQNLRIYRSMFDPLPAQTLRVGALDSATKGMTAVTRTSSGDYDIYFAVVDIIPYDPLQTAPYHRRITFYRVRYSAGALSAPVAIYSSTRSVDKADPVIYGKPATRSIDGNANTDLFGLDFPTTVHYGTDSAQQRTTSIEFSIDSTGRFKLDRSYGTIYENSSDSPSGYIPAGEPVDRTTSILRIPSDTASVVRVTVLDKSTDLTAPVGYYTDPATRLNPVIHNLNGDLLVSWQRGNGFDLGHWSGTDAVATSIDAVLSDTIAPLPGDPIRTDSLVHTMHQAVLVRAAQTGLPAVIIQEKRSDDMAYRSSPETIRQYQSVQAYSVLNVASPGGWRRRVIELETKAIAPNDSDAWMAGVGWNPNSRAVTVTYGVNPGPLVHLTDVGAGDTFKMSFAVPDRGAIVPVAGAEYLLAQEDSLFDYDAARRIGSMPIPMVPDGTAEHRRLFGSWFLRSTLSTPGTLYTFERFDFMGNRLNAMPLSFASPISDPHLFQDDRDSTLILLYIRDGIRMARLTQDLHLLFSDSLIIAPAVAGSPAGAVRNDTLFVVWRNDLDGHVHGTWTPLTEQHGSTSSVHAATVDEGAGGVTIAGLAPNPAHDFVTVEWSARSGADAMIEVIDRLGRIVMRQIVPAESTATHATRLETSGLESGVYMLRLRSGDREASSRMIIVH